MSIRAWLVRRQIKKLFRRDLFVKPGEPVPEPNFLEALSFSESRMPQPPKSTIVEAVEAEWNGQAFKGEWVYEPGTEPNRILFYSHGGGYVWGSPKVYRDLAWRLSKACKARVFLLDYSLAPDAQYPTQVKEGLAALEYVRDQYPAAGIAMSGDSAGGNLTAALMLAVRDSGRIKPVAVSLISPWLDMTGAGESMTVNGKKDVMLRPDGVEAAAKAYAGATPPDDPGCSPLFANHENLPPILMQVGSEEILLDDSVRFYQSLFKVKANATLKVWEKMHHVWHMSAGIVPEGQKAIQQIADFFEKYWSDIK